MYINSKYDSLPVPKFRIPPQASQVWGLIPAYDLTLAHNPKASEPARNSIGHLDRDPVILAYAKVVWHGFLKLECELE